MDLVELRDEECGWQCCGIFGAGGSLGRRLLPRPRRPLSGALPATGGLPRVSPMPATPVRGLRQTALLLQTPPPTQLRHCKSQHCFHIAIFSLNRSFQNRYFAENLFLQAIKLKLNSRMWYSWPSVVPSKFKRAIVKQTFATVSLKQIKVFTQNSRVINSISLNYIQTIVTIAKIIF